MNTPVLHHRAAALRRIVCLFGMVLCPILLTPRVFSVTLAGSNGKAVQFHLIKSATPKGLTAQMVADGPVIGIPWDKLDLAALERDHKSIHEAYQLALKGESVELNLTDGADGKAGGEGKMAGDTAAPSQATYFGWLDTKVGKTEFMLQMPIDKPRAILLLSQDDFGDAFSYVRNQQRGSGVWGVFQGKFDMAILTYNTHNDERDPTVVDNFIYAEKGSGKALLSALTSFGSKLKQPELANLPIAVFGADRTGAAFAYNFVHQYPERILTAAFYDGAFYDAAPTEATVKIPMLFIWGQYSNRAELWRSENTSVTALTKAAPMKSLWTNAREFRGRGEMNEVVEHFAKQYLIAMCDARMPKEGEASIQELDRGTGSIGNILTGEVLKITDPGVVTAEDESYVPNETVIRYWKSFVLGELEAPAREPVQ